MSTFERWDETLDSDEPLGKLYVFPFTLPDGVTLTADIKVVDELSKDVAPSPIVTISDVQVLNVSGNSWDVLLRAKGTGVDGLAYVRCRYALSNGAGDDWTAILLVRQR